MNKILLIILCLAFSLYAQNEELWRIWSGELCNTNITKADSIDNYWIDYWAGKLEIKKEGTHILLNGDTLTYPSAPQEIWMPLIYTWNTSDSAIDVILDYTFTSPMRWWTEFENAAIVDADYEITVEQIYTASPAKKKKWKVKAQNSLSPTFRVILSEKDKNLAKEKYKKKSIELNNLINAQIFAKSTDGKTHNVFGNTIDEAGLIIIWPSQYKQKRNLIWRLMKLQSKGRIIFNVQQPSN